MKVRKKTPPHKAKPKEKKKRKTGLKGLASRLANQGRHRPDIREIQKLGGPKKGYVPIKYWLKKILSGPARHDRVQFVSLAHEIADILIESAMRGGKSFPYLKLLIESMDRDSPVTLEDLERKVRWVFSVVAKHVSDTKTLAAIAKELDLMEDD